MNTYKITLAIVFIFHFHFIFSQSCVVFQEDFSAKKDWQEKLAPYGVPGACAFASGAVFSYNGKEALCTTYAYFESALRKIGLNLPADDYQINVKFKIGPNAEFRTNVCGSTNFDDRFGAECIVPNRVFAINNVMLDQKEGNYANKKFDLTFNYSGKIDSIDLANVGNCSITEYLTYYDEITIKKKSLLPQIKFGHSINGNIVTLTDSTVGATSGYKWNTEDGRTSTDSMPSFDFEVGLHSVCLVRSNACGKDSVCVDIQVDSAGNPNGVSNMDFQKNKFNIDINKINNVDKIKFQSDHIIRNIQVIDMNGRTLRTENFEVKTGELILPENKGLLFLKICDTKGNLKVIKYVNF